MFDVDGTLIVGIEVYGSTYDLFQSVLLQKWKNVDVYVWSGRGEEYAKTVTQQMINRGRLLIGDDQRKKLKYASKSDHKSIHKKYSSVVVVDDIQDTALGDVNMIVRNK